MKKILSTILTITMLMSLAACGAQEQPGAMNTENTENVQAVEETETA